ncbi:MAG: crossover junction endodeoxyribonuclease RuvC [Candidatus Omnitrophica bacterium]|nr:crossover junction endodeoxyribonuclease RuvC [Candidatus Omnitrophota bacterium]
MRILGVDPGLRITGYGVISDSGRPRARGNIELVEAGIIRTKAGSGIAARLERVYRALQEVVAELKPEVLVIEKLYAHYRHPATAILMGHVRGVVCLLSGTSGIPLVNLAATRVKKSVTGNGRAGKGQTARMVERYLSLRTVSAPSDATDALAIALSYALNRKF